MSDRVNKAICTAANLERVHLFIRPIMVVRRRQNGSHEYLFVSLKEQIRDLFSVIINETK